MKIGLLAGYGDLPANIARNLKKSGFVIVSIGFSEEVTVDLTPYSDMVYTISLGQVGKILKILKREEVKSVVFAGKVNKTLLYRNMKLDFLAINLLTKMKDRKDDTIMGQIVSLLEDHGIKVINQTDIIKDNLSQEKVYTIKKPGKNELEDVAFGFSIAKGMGKMDIGQTVVVKGKAVMAVEAIEGTDEAIKRGCKLAGKGAVIVKVAKPSQDKRFDVPTIGSDTIKHVADNGGSVLAVEAESTFIIDFDECVRLANKYSIIFIGYKH